LRLILASYKLLILFLPIAIFTRLYQVGLAMPFDDRTGRRLKLRDLNIFVVVAKERSMSKVAAQLAVSQPAVSKAIAEMEFTLGVPLLDRGPRGVDTLATRFVQATQCRDATTISK
jgi:hypothetical protein